MMSICSVLVEISPLNVVSERPAMEIDDTVAEVVVEVVDDN